MTNNKPYLLYFPKAGSVDIGYISIAEINQILPFAIQRVFWTYETPAGIIRGKHGHKMTEVVLIAAAGIITVHTENPLGEQETFELIDPSVGLYIPPSVWHTMTYTTGAIQIALASSSYTEQDYLRTKESFFEYWNKK